MSHSREIKNETKITGNPFLLWADGRGCPYNFFDQKKHGRRRCARREWIDGHKEEERSKKKVVTQREKEHTFDRNSVKK